VPFRTLSLGVVCTWVPTGLCVCPNVSTDERGSICRSIRVLCTVQCACVCTSAHQILGEGGLLVLSSVSLSLEDWSRAPTKVKLSTKTEEFLSSGPLGGTAGALTKGAHLHTHTPSDPRGYGLCTNLTLLGPGSGNTTAFPSWLVSPSSRPSWPSR
jgi:hypothetical protein